MALLVLAFVVMLVPAFAATDPVPDHVKAITPEDTVSDSYTITLTVTGKDQETSSSSTTVESTHADIVLVLDATYSMSSTLSDGTTRFAAMQKAAKQFVSGLENDSESHISMLYFQCYDTNTRNTPVTVAQNWTAITSSSKSSLQSTIDSIPLVNQTYGYDTYYAPPLDRTDDLLSASAVNNDNNKYVIFFSDGEASDSFTSELSSVKSKATVFSVGVEPKYWYDSTDKIKSVASDESKFYLVSDTDSFVEAFQNALNIIIEETTVSTEPMTEVTISDELSKYVEQAGSISVNASDGSTVSFTDKSSGDTVAVEIPELKDGVTYILSIPVKPSQTAQDEANKASAEVSKFPSNNKATLEYSYGREAREVTYSETPSVLVERVLTHSLNYDANGGSGAPAKQTVTGSASSADFTVSSTEPVRANYDFLGWSDSKNATEADYKAGDTITVSGDKTLYAVWAIKTFTITWKNEDGTILETDKDVPYGSTPSYDGDTPTKASDATKTYTFDKWTPEIATVTGDATYTATFKETTKTATITWKNEDGTVLEKDTDVPYGSPPSYDGATPTKAADENYTYTFKEWTPSITEVAGDATYTATYTQKAVDKTYTLSYDANGGSGAPAKESKTTTASSADFTVSSTEPVRENYDFLGWADSKDAAEADYKSRDKITVSGDKTLYAVWAIQTFTITWVDEDGTVLEKDMEVPYGATPSYDGATPTKAADASYNYTFKEWTPTITEVTGDTTYTATYTKTIKTATITWKNEDGTILETDEDVPYGSTPSYDGAAPTKDSDDTADYVFDKWTPNVVSVTGDATYTATFTKKTKTATITWKNEDGTVLETDKDVPYGSTPSYDGDTPTKDSDATKTYTFDKWTPEIVSVTGDATYTATFKAMTKTATIIWKNEDGTILETDTDVPYGSTPSYDGATPTKDSDDTADYVFDKWTPDVASVTGDATYTATFTKKNKTATITWKNEDGTVLETDKDVPYGSTPSYDGDMPTKEADSSYEYTFAGWDPEIVSVTGDATYTATYDKKAIITPTPIPTVKPTVTPKPSVKPVEKKVTLHYESNGGTEYKDEQYTKGTKVDLDKKPVKDGYVFVGWYLDEKLKQAADSVTMDSDKTVYARWDIYSEIPAELESEEHLWYVSGYPDGTVRPTRNLTRAEAATIFYRLLKNDSKVSNSTSECSFKDVPQGKFYTVPVATLAKMGIVSGRNSDTFDPNATITRAEFAAICVAFDKTNPDTLKTFSDVTGGWAKQYIEKAAALGWVSGYEDGTFRPKNNITRAEAMMLINKMLHRLPQTLADLHEDMIKWPDNADTTVWYYLPVQEATNSHEYRYKENNLYEKWTGIIKDE